MMTVTPSSDNKLANPSCWIQITLWVLQREAFIIVLMTVYDHIGTGVI